MEVDPRGFINELMRNVRKAESRMTLSFLVWVPEKCRTQALGSQPTWIFVLASLLDQHDIFKFISHMTHLPQPGALPQMTKFCSQIFLIRREQRL